MVALKRRRAKHAPDSWSRSSQSRPRHSPRTSSCSQFSVRSLQAEHDRGLEAERDLVVPLKARAPRTRGASSRKDYLLLEFGAQHVACKPSATAALSTARPDSWSRSSQGDEAEYRRRLESFFRHTLMSVMGYDAEICGLPPTATQDKKGFRFYASSGEAQQAFMEAEQISFAEFQRIFDSVDKVHAYS